MSDGIPNAANPTADDLLPGGLPNAIISVEQRADALIIRSRLNRRVGWITMAISMLLSVLVLMVEPSWPFMKKVTLAVFAAYFVSGLYEVVNVVTHTITREQWRITQSPLPYPSQTLDLSNASQLFVRRLPEAPPSKRFRLVLWTTNGEERELMRFADDPLARFFEHEIEDWLGIDDQPVPGEYRPTGKRDEKRGLSAIVHRRLRLRTDPTEPASSAKNDSEIAPDKRRHRIQ